MEQRETHQSHCGILLGVTPWKILSHSGQSSLIQRARDFAYSLLSMAPPSWKVTCYPSRSPTPIPLPGTLKEFGGIPCTDWCYENSPLLAGVSLVPIVWRPGSHFLGCTVPSEIDFLSICFSSLCWESQSRSSRPNSPKLACFPSSQDPASLNGPCLL